LARPPLPPLPEGGRSGELFGPGRHRSAWLLGGLFSVLIVTLISIEIAHSRLLQQPAVFAEVHVDAPLLKLMAGSPAEFEDDLQTHAELITKTAMLTAALKRSAIADLALVKRQEPNGVRWLARHVRVESRSPKTLRILYLGEPSIDAPVLINGIAATYIDEMLELTSRLRAERIDELERSQRDIEHRLGEKQDAISRLVKLLASGEKASGEKWSTNGQMIGIWTRELEELKKAVIEGEEIDERITGELAKLRNPPRESAVGLIRMAAY